MSQVDQQHAIADVVASEIGSGFVRISRTRKDREAQDDVADDRGSILDEVRVPYADHELAPQDVTVVAEQLHEEAKDDVELARAAVVEGDLLRVDDQALMGHSVVTFEL